MTNVKDNYVDQCQDNSPDTRSGPDHPATQNNASANPPGNPLLAAIWRTPDLYHQLGSLNRQNNKFSNLLVGVVADAISQAQKLSSEGNEVYFACAEYLTPDSRVAANAYGACGFWMDIDCDEYKAAAGKGYAKVKDAKEALIEFSEGLALDAGKFP